MTLPTGAKRRGTTLVAVMAAVWVLVGLAAFRDEGTPVYRLLQWLRPPATELWPTAATVPVVPPVSPAIGLVSAATETQTLRAMLDGLVYDLDQVRQGAIAVPPLFITHFPQDMKDKTEGQSRKDLFVEVMLPLILFANDQILLQRERMLDILARIDAGQVIEDSDTAWLQALADRHKTSPENIRELKSRVDAIPPSLVLAQAATESAWGTSRFARVGNAMFGQWTWNKEEGILPLNRDANKTHFIKAYATLFASVTDYMRNLNSHKAYTLLRKIRMDARTTGSTASGAALAAGLDKYSEKGMDYVHGLRDLIDRNGYQYFDSNARLGRTVTEREIAASH